MQTSHCADTTAIANWRQADHSPRGAASGTDELKAAAKPVEDIIKCNAASKQRSPNAMLQLFGRLLSESLEWPSCCAISESNLHGERKAFRPGYKLGSLY